MSIHVKNAGSWSMANMIFVKSGTTWNRAKEVWIKESGQWKMAHLRELNITFSANTPEYNIKAAAIAYGWDQETPLFANVVIGPGVVVYGTNAQSFALSTGHNWPPGSYVEIHNNGTIVGMGGRGGKGGGVEPIPFVTIPEQGQPGGNGGTALVVGVSTVIYNYGRIAGGGGGGAGADAAGWDDNGVFGFANISGGGGGGGGQSGIVQSAGGAGGNSTGSGGTDGTGGANGTFIAFGSGGPGGNLASAGGAGRGWGNAGISVTGNPGGAGGLYLQGVSNVTFVVIGTRNGGTA